MKYQKKCECCGHVSVAYTHTLNAGLVKALRRLVDFYEQNQRPAEMKELSLTNSQYINFNRLIYFGMAQLIPTVGDKKGGWVPTAYGFDFIYGRFPIKIPVAIMEGRILPEDHEAWQSHKGTRETKYVMEIDEESYKQKEDYQKKTANTLL